MQIGFIGLGKMGGLMVKRLLSAGHEVVVYDQSKEVTGKSTALGVVGASSIANLAGKLTSPRVIWLMIPAGTAVQEAVNELLPLLSAGDILIDGGNSFYKDSVGRAQLCREKKIHFLDVGTSGGVWGGEKGYCLMVGGEAAAFKKMEPIFSVLAPKEGYRHVGVSGAGHYVKMVHNAIEYGMLQAYGEGFALLKASEFKLDLEKIAHLWNQGSVVRSWLLELSETMFREDASLSSFPAWIDDSGEGRWAVQDAIEKGISAPVITHALLARLESRTKESFSAKVIAGLRKCFGGHSAAKKS